LSAAAITALGATPNATGNFDYRDGAQANNAQYVPGGASINPAEPGNGPANTFFNAVWDWPPPAGTGSNFNATSPVSIYNLNFATAISLSDLLATNSGGYATGLKVAGYNGGGNGNSAVLGGRLFAVPEPASMIAGLLGLPCVGGVVSLVRRRMGGVVA
jgi:hypothetical protein